VIATLSGRLRRKLEDRVVVECGGIGYEVFLPPIALRQIEHVGAAGREGSELELVIYYHATRDQPRPVLIGFTSDLDKEFFEKLITVKDIGPMVAARALALPVGELAAAIARQDEKFLRGLPGVGPQKAKNIVAQLQNKVAKFALAREGAPASRRRRAGARRRRRSARDGVGDHGQAARPSPVGGLAADHRRAAPAPASCRRKSCSTRSTAERRRDAAPADEGKILSRVAAPEEAQFERQLRPRTFEEYVGQEQAVRASACRSRRRRCGASAWTTCSSTARPVSARRRSPDPRQRDGHHLVTTAGPAIERGGDLMGS
jgi:Holliday junction DNA helicase RuvA